MAKNKVCYLSLFLRICDILYDAFLFSFYSIDTNLPSKYLDAKDR